MPWIFVNCRIIILQWKVKQKMTKQQHDQCRYKDFMHFNTQSNVGIDVQCQVKKYVQSNHTVIQCAVLNMNTPIKHRLTLMSTHFATRQTFVASSLDSCLAMNASDKSQTV